MKNKNPVNKCANEQFSKEVKMVKKCNKNVQHPKP
jgi:hypothetical protein